MAARRPRLHYAYVVAALAFVLLIAAAGIRSSPTMLIEPLEHEFHWSVATISAALALNLVLFGFVGPFAAGIFERFGLRRTIAAALVLTALAAAASTLMTQTWEFVLLWGLLVGIGTGSIGLVAGATIVNRWFDTNRGTVMGDSPPATPRDSSYSCRCSGCSSPVPAGASRCCSSPPCAPCWHRSRCWCCASTPQT